MKRLLATFAIISCITGAGLVTPAAALRQADSTWTDYQLVKWRGGTSGYVTTTTDNALVSTSSNSFCNQMSWSGTSAMFVKQATATTITDFWGVHTAGTVSITGPDGVRRNGSYNSATWETTTLGNTQTHAYDDVPVVITSDQQLYSIKHTVNATRHIGRRSYDGPMLLRFESVCFDTP